MLPCVLNTSKSVSAVIHFSFIQSPAAEDANDPPVPLVDVDVPMRIC